ncbi:MAG: trypsin-like peptidase domain-containing protein, partial [Oscillospiraceae bacterium]|nr:trypsin-like peptidase domain-containing protein [Oscillospiraceae bacterium]
MTDDELRTLLGNEQYLNDDPFRDAARAGEKLPERASEPAAPPAFSFAPPAPEGDTPAAEAAVPPRPNRHAFLYFMLTLLVLGVLAFSVFVVIWDVRNGTTSGGYRAGSIVRVELVQNRREPTPDQEADENGRYSFAGIAQVVMPSIVEIYTYKDGTMGGTGSGIILTADGYIATNAHVLEDATSYSVRLFDESQQDVQYSAVLVGHDSKTDLAVLKISAANLKPAVLGDANDVHIGEEVCALGNPAGLSGSITTGIISGMNRKVRAKSTNFEMDCIQTDAAISPGNSGGALVDMYGQVIGITSSKYGASMIFGGSYEGLGFAITINQALPILQELMEKGYVSGRVRIGIQFLDNK